VDPTSQNFFTGFSLRSSSVLPLSPVSCSSWRRAPEAANAGRRGKLCRLPCRSSSLLLRATPTVATVESRRARSGGLARRSPSGPRARATAVTPTASRAPAAVRAPRARSHAGDLTGSHALLSAELRFSSHLHANVHGLPCTERPSYGGHRRRESSAWCGRASTGACGEVCTERLSFSGRQWRGSPRGAAEFWPSSWFILLGLGSRSREKVWAPLRVERRVATLARRSGSRFFLFPPRRMKADVAPL
jgi:hypothetical protein